MVTIPVFIAILLSWLAIVHTVIAIKDNGKMYDELCGSEAPERANEVSE